MPLTAKIERLAGLCTDQTPPSAKKRSHPKNLAQRQYADYMSTHSDSLRYPRDSKPDGTLGETGPADWTSGFFPGCLWYLYRFTRDRQWANAANRWTRGLAAQQYNTGTHDLGFMLYTSYGNGYELTKDSSYRSVLLQGAKSLSTRFHPQVGAIRSWDNPDFHYPVIIDNLMNLEYLFHATALSGDSSFYKIALAHANTDLRYRFRPDNSSYHVLDFDPVSGQLLRRMTHQGYSDSSCWASCARPGASAAIRYCTAKPVIPAFSGALSLPPIIFFRKPTRPPIISRIGISRPPTHYAMLPPPR